MTEQQAREHPGLVEMRAELSRLYPFGGEPKDRLGIPGDRSWRVGYSEAITACLDLLNDLSPTVLPVTVEEVQKSAASAYAEYRRMSDIKQPVASAWLARRNALLMVLGEGEVRDATD